VVGGLASISPEYVAYARITLRTNAAYTGATGRCRIEAVAYLTGSRSSIASAGGISDAPNDAVPYVRQSQAWADLTTVAVRLTGDQTVAGSKTLTSPVLFGAVAANQYEQWFREDVTTFPVITYRPTTDGTVCAYDLMPRGTPTDAGFGYAWMDVCNKDVRAGAADVGTLHLEMGSGGAFVSCNAYGAETQQPLKFGIGTVRFLTLETTGGLLHAGGSASAPTTTQVAIGGGWVDAGSGLRGDALEVQGQTISTTGNIAALSTAASFTRLSGAAPVVQGIVAPTGSRMLFIYCANSVTFKHQDAAATDVDRILSSTAADIVVAATKTVLFIYDHATDRWRDVRF
jgi:hypothetical protein